MKTAIYPGSFDPLTNGHINIISRASKLFDKIIILISDNNQKKHMFNVNKRLNFIENSILRNKFIKLDTFNGLLVNYLYKKKIKIIIKGIRSVKDFEYEKYMSIANKQLDKEIETCFLLSDIKYSFISSKLIKEIAIHGGDVSSMVSKIVNDALCKKFSHLF
jgi:pantetheine-phosphate adenylyltransferase